MSGNVQTIFDHYTHSETAQPATEAEENPRIYRALTLESRRNVPRLRIQYQDGTLAVLAYAYLVEAVCTSHQYLSLIFTHCILTLEGRHLDRLIGPLQDEKIRMLQCYRTAMHDAPGTGEPVITKILRQHPHEVLNGTGTA